MPSQAAGQQLETFGGVALDIRVRHPVESNRLLFFEASRPRSRLREGGRIGEGADDAKRHCRAPNGRYACPVSLACALTERSLVRRTIVPANLTGRRQREHA